MQISIYDRLCVSVFVCLCLAFVVEKKWCRTNSEIDSGQTGTESRFLGPYRAINLLTVLFLKHNFFLLWILTLFFSYLILFRRTATAGIILSQLRV